ncbi:rho GTPase-activating protein 6 isoform X1 [Megalobrama amblycephala]|uniref:rho GTPase-activating protein 6 isoform X1 n=2 Tax=Megalobrama amblycephala TaxID=75352 RepID=UPI0020142016|nr:rho GTPase-activating protein 6 isoform X1 [Megalobrama amblycephala]
MSAQGLLNSVFSCSSSGSKTLAKRKLQQTRSLDSALMRNGATPGDANTVQRFSSSTAGFTNSQTASEDSRLKQRLSSSSLSTSSDASSISSAHFDYRSGKRNASRDLSLNLSGSSNIFSPRKWLQRKLPQSDAVSHNICKSEGDFTCKKTSGHNFHMQSVPIQSLSELERVRLQEVALVRLMKDFDLGCQITIPKDGQKRKKSLRRKLDSLSKEKRDKDSDPQAFGVPLSQVIFNDRRQKQLQEEREQEEQEEQEEQRSPADRVSSLLHLTGRRSTNKELSSSNSSLSSSSETPNDSTSPGTPETALRSRRRGGMSVDCITDLDDSHSRLLEALQLSMPVESPSEKKKMSDAKLSLNPIYRQVPRVLDSCCQHLQKYGLQTVGIFRVGSSKKRVRQLREAFDQGAEVVLDQRHSVHDVAALLKEFLRDMPDPLLTRELYSAFISCASLDKSDQHTAIQLLICLLPACNSDTLQCLLHFLSNVANHAEDSRDADGKEVIGNKMTSLNLATIFGPNLLHKQKSSEKEFSVQSSARMEDSAAIIAIVQHMIDTHQTLFMISAELQNEVLVSLLDTDSDVVDYLLRRKTPQCEDSKCSSGEISPYDNNSPVLSEWFHPSGQEHHGLSDVQDALAGDVTVNFCLSPSQADSGEMLHDKARIWRTRHTLLSGLHDKLLTGSDGNLYKRASSDVFYDDDSDAKPVLETQESRTNVPRLQTPHAPITSSQSQEATVKPSPSAKQDDRLQLRVTSCLAGQGAGSHIAVPSKTFSAEQHPDWPTEKWQIWQLLSSDSIDTLPETMV